MNPDFGALVRVGGAAIFLLAAGGCDTPASGSESLLRFRRSPETTGPLWERGPLVPALAFSSQRTSSIAIVDVAVEGDFPSDFWLEVYDPLPESALDYLTYITDDEPLVAFGNIVAAERDHPEWLPQSDWNDSVEFGCTELRDDGLCLRREEKYCASKLVDLECYVGKTYCPSQDAPDAECTIEESGDPVLKGDVSDYFTVVSNKYWVAYFDEEATKGSAAAAYFGSPDTIPQGYGLYELWSFSDEEVDETVACWKAAEPLALELYNKDHGTDYDRWECPATDPDTDLEDLPEFCLIRDDDGQPEYEPWRSRLPYEDAARLKRGCPLTQNHFKRVERPREEAISIKLNPSRISR